ncbi:leukosialin [Grammomys surdaster]|uniref:leukosialin n=1 Tax=Grammomys surdaster TaxID=491861 RepID=UPI0010A03A97|nr:leukosialin [Grammomys surdaster]XP_028631006.1 leukosialin [Grammomys surdaster]
MALLLLLIGGFWAQVVSSVSLQNTTMLASTPHIKTPSTSEALSVVNSSTSMGPVTVGTNETITMGPVTVGTNETITMGPVTVDTKEIISPWSQTPTPAPSIPLGTIELPFWGTSAGTSMTTPVPESTTSQQVSSKTSVLVPGQPDVANDPPVTATNPVTDRTVASIALETIKGPSAPPVTVTTSSAETSGPSVATTVSSKTSGPPVTMATGSLEPSNEMHGLPATKAASSVESSSVARGTTISSIKTSTMSTPDPITTRSPWQGSSGMLLVPMLIALMVVLALVALLLLWRQRQKRRTGALTLSRGGKRNGVMDAWAGPAQVPDEEATTTSGSGGNKGSGVLETEASRQRPTLTTFFSRRKSRQGSLVLEELKPESGPNLKGEEEPLMGSESEAVETPTSDGPQAKDGAAPQSL